MMIFSAFAAKAQGNLLVSADEKAKKYSQQMENLFELKEKQLNEIYRLRFELSLAVNLAAKKLAEQPEKLNKKLAAAQQRFEAGIKKTLKNEQFTAWTEYRQNVLKNHVNEPQTGVADFNLQ
jgi:predicted RNA-binding protein with RPS1 domain